MKELYSWARQVADHGHVVVPLAEDLRGLPVVRLSRGILAADRFQAVPIAPPDCPRWLAKRSSPDSRSGASWKFFMAGY